MHAVCMSLDRSFAPAELSALRLAAAAFSVLGRTLLCDEPDVLSARVTIARGDASTRLVVDRLSAAWAWGAVLRTFRFDDVDVVQTSAGPVLSRWRTLLHVLRWDSDEHPEAVQALADSLGFELHDVTAEITERVHPTAQRRYLEPLSRLLATSR